MKETVQRTAEFIEKEIRQTGVMINKKMTSSQMLSEELKLQDICLCEVFNEDHAANLRYEDIVRHFENVAAQKGLSDDPIILEANENMRRIAKEIAIMISGVNGEKQVAKVIQYARRKVIVLQNVILSDGEDITEIDFVLITSTGILLLEVKNYKKNILITEGGKTVGPNGKEYSDKCLGEQMNVKRHLLTTKLKNLIKSEGLDIPVVVDSLVVFSNSSINVEDQYKREKYCFKSNLPHEIDDYRSTVLYSENQMTTLSYLIKELAEEEAEYEVEMDFDRFRHTFALALEKIESSTELVENQSEQLESTPNEAICFKSIPLTKKNIFGACLALCGAGLLGSGVTYLTCKKLKLC